jgi:flavin reductase (DIM6/NTAB) family NADH-FMN oxidoreductase RutF
MAFLLLKSNNFGQNNSCFMLTVVPGEIAQNLLHGYLVGAVGPRPICFASTIDENGKPNLAPFSFFNVFSSNPPLAVFSPAISGRTGSTKHTHDNVKKVPEVVINVVSYGMVEQTSVASGEYAKEVNEFEKSGFTAIPSVKVKPFRVKESPVQMECKVLEVKEMGKGGGGGNLIICEIIMIHINEDILDAEKKIVPQKIDLVGRLGGNWYTRANGDALFELRQPNMHIGIGVDALPADVRNSHILTGNNLGQLASLTQMPAKEKVDAFKTSEGYKVLKNASAEERHKAAKGLLGNKQIEEALIQLLAFEK